MEAQAREPDLGTVLGDCPRVLEPAWAASQKNGVIWEPRVTAASLPATAAKPPKPKPIPARVDSPLWVIGRHVGLHEKASALRLKADIHHRAVTDRIGSIHG